MGRDQELESLDNQLTEKKKVSKDLPEDSSLGKYFEEDCGKLEPGMKELDVKAEMKSEVEHSGNENNDELDIIYLEARRHVLGLRNVLGVRK